MDKKIVVGMGEVLWDMLPESKKIGGAPANFSYHVSQFGLPSYVVSAVGNDVLGKEIIDVFIKRGLDFSLSQVPYPTGIVEVDIDKAGVPQYKIKENVAWDNIPFTENLEDIARNTSAFCFGSLAQRNIVSRESINAFLNILLKDGHALIVFDVNLRQGFYTKEILSNSLEKCNILKINDEELVVLSHLFGIDRIDFQEKCWFLLEKYNLDILILTCGINGSYVFSSGNLSFLPTPKVKVEDTVGAGDSFTAAFIAGILKGLSVADAHLKAVETSAFVCSQKGAMPKLPKSITG